MLLLIFPAQGYPCVPKLHGGTAHPRLVAEFRGSPRTWKISGLDGSSFEVEVDGSITVAGTSNWSV